MKRMFFLSLILIVFFSCSKQTQKQMKLTYPNPKKVDSSTNFFGTIVKDPYRWMDEESDADLKTWIEQENELTRNYLSQNSLQAPICISD